MITFQSRSSLARMSITVLMAVFYLTPTYTLSEQKDVISRHMKGSFDSFSMSRRNYLSCSFEIIRLCIISFTDVLIVNL